VISNATLLMVNAYRGVDIEAAKPWVYGGAATPLITGVTG